MSTNLKKIGELLHIQRKNKGLTQEEVGSMIGVQKAMVSKVENGLCVNFNTISRIAEALEVEPMVELKSVKKPDKNIIDYVMTAIIEFAKRYGLTVREAITAQTWRLTGSILRNTVLTRILAKGSI